MKLFLCSVALLAIFCLCGCMIQWPWGKKDPLPTVKGIPNYFCLDPVNRIYRGGQPKDESGWKYLLSLGVTNVVKLNTVKEGSDAVAQSLNMRVQYFPIDLDDQIVYLPEKYLDKIVSAITPGTFIHCGSDARTRSAFDRRFDLAGGQDRTGIACAAYRLRVMGWPEPLVRAELFRFGFHQELIALWRAYLDFKP